MDGDLAALRLAAITAARLCHDLSGSLGAVLNGLELALTQDGMAAEAMAFAQEAAREVAARLRLARALWDADNPLELGRLPQLADGLPNRGRLQLDFSGLAGAALPPHRARVALAAMLTAAESLHGAGAITLAGDTGRELVVMIDGPRAAWPDPLAGTAELLEPRSLAPRLLGLFAEAADARLSLLLSAGTASGPPPLLVSWQGGGARF